MPSVPFSSAASSSSIDLDLYRPEALSDEENIFVLQPDNNLWLTPSAPSSSTPSAPSSSAPRYADTPRYLLSTSSSTGISSSSSSRTSTISISGNSSNSNSNSNSNSDSSSVSSSNGSASTSSSSGAKERDKATKKFAELQPRRRQQLNNTLRRRCMEAAERTLPKDDHKERHDVLQVLPIASLFTYTLYSFDFDNYSPTNSSIPSKPFSHNLLKFIKYKNNDGVAGNLCKWLNRPNGSSPSPSSSLLPFYPLFPQLPSFNLSISFVSNTTLSQFAP